MSPTDLDQAAAILAAARRNGEKIDDLPPLFVPRTLESACAIQLNVTRELGPIGAWKVMLPKPGGFAKGSAIALPFVQSSGSVWPAADRPRLEVELALRLGHTIDPAATDLTRDSILEAIADVHLAFEVLGHRFHDRARVHELTYLADGQGNAGMVVGSPLPAWRHTPLERLPIELWAGSTQLAKADSGPSLTETLDGLLWLARHAASLGVPLQQGQYVLTGARIGGTNVPPQQPIEARADEARVSMTLT